MKLARVFTLQELSELLGLPFKGDPQCRVDAIASLEQAEKGQLSFLSNPAYHRFLGETKASVVILTEADLADCPTHTLIAPDPRLSLTQLLTWIEREERQARSPSIHPTAVFGEGAVVPKSVIIGAYCVLGDHVILGESVILGAGTVIGDGCRIGDQTELKAQVTLYSQVVIGKNCLIHSGVVLGSDGFGLAYEKGRWIKTPQLGTVVIHDHVEIGANSAVDRGSLEDTVIEEGVKIDNLVQIAHNVRIGAHTAIAGCVAIAGSTTIGKQCLIGGGSSIAGHLHITDHVQITGTTAVNRSLNEAGRYSSGLPAKPSAVWLKNAARFNFLDEMARRLTKLERLIFPEKKK